MMDDKVTDELIAMAELDGKLRDELAASGELQQGYCIGMAAGPPPYPQFA